MEKAKIMHEDYGDEDVVDALDEIYLVMVEDLSMETPYSRRALYSKFYNILKKLKDGGR